MATQIPLQLPVAVQPQAQAGGATVLVGSTKRLSTGATPTSTSSGQRVVQQVVLPQGVVVAAQPPLTNSTSSLGSAVKIPIGSQTLPMRENSGVLPGAVVYANSPTPRTPVSPGSFGNVATPTAATTVVYPGSIGQPGVPTRTMSQQVFVQNRTASGAGVSNTVVRKVSQIVPPSTAAAQQDAPRSPVKVLDEVAKTAENPEKAASPFSLKSEFQNYMAAVGADASKITVSSEEDDRKEISVTLNPGSLGMAANYETGEVGQVNAGQCKVKGVEMGWRFHKIDGLPYSEPLLDAKLAGRAPFEVIFLA